MEFVSSAEVAAMVACIDLRDPMGGRDHAMITLLAHTGLRVAELVGIDHFDVISENRVRPVLFVRAAIAKGGHARQVPLNPTARQAIEQVIRFNRARGFSTEPKAPLFVTKTHHRITTRAVQYVVKALREQANLAVPATPHSFRHHFASRVAETTGNTAIVQRLLGHRHLSTTGIYTHSSLDELAAAVEGLCPEVKP